MKFWRENLIRIVVFLDDGLGMNNDYQKALKDSFFVKDSLTKAGFIIYEEKSIWEPLTALEWTGIWWDGLEYFICIPDRRILDLKTELDFVCIRLPFITARVVAKLVGKIISMMPVIGNAARLMTRHLYVLVHNKLSWDSSFKIKNEDRALDEIFFWKNTVDKLNKKFLLQSSLPETLVFSDASQSAAGEYSVSFRDSIFHAFWSENDSKKSSTFREIKAISFALESYKDMLQCKNVKWFSDSQSCVKIIQSGSFKVELQELACQIYHLCAVNSISLEILWIPRLQNSQADFISKAVDYDDWGVSNKFFEFMEQMWGPHDVDRFANHENTKLQRFNSVVWNPGCEQVDAFSQNWAGENNWIVPPIYLVIQVMRHIVLCKATGTMIVPKWKSAQFWPLLFDENSFCSNFVAEILEFDNSQPIFVQGRNKNSLFGSKKFRSNVLAIRFEPKV